MTAETAEGAENKWGETTSRMTSAISACSAVNTSPQFRPGVLVLLAAGYEVEIHLQLHEHADGHAPHPSRSEEALANGVSRGALERRV